MDKSESFMDFSDILWYSVIAVNSMRVLLANLLCELYQKRNLNRQNALNSSLALIVDLIRDLLQGQINMDIRLRIRDHLIQNLATPDMDMSHLASHFGCSSDHLRRVFCRTHGCSPMHYLTQQRMLLAQTLLKQMPVYSIGEIAGQCGYSDRFYFSRCFRRHTGLSPSKYRKLHTA